MFEATPPHTNTDVLKWILMLTNAPWLIPLGVECDGSHRHTILEGKYITMSNVSCEGFCVACACALGQAPLSLTLLNVRMPLQRKDSWLKVVRSLSNHYQELPRCYSHVYNRRVAHHSPSYCSVTSCRQRRRGTSRAGRGVRLFARMPGQYQLAYTMNIAETEKKSPWLCILSRCGCTGPDAENYDEVSSLWTPPSAKLGYVKSFGHGSGCV